MRNARSNVIALALMVAVASGAAAQTEPFADVDNDGVFGPNDVPIGALIENDGQFSTARAEGAYVPPAGPVGIVVPSRFASRRHVLALTASGDINVHGHLSAGGKGAVLMLVSTGGSLNVDPGLRLQTGAVLQLIAQNDVNVGAKVELRGKGADFSMVSVASQAGDVHLGENVQIGASGLVELATGDADGGCVEVGKGARLTGGSGDARVTAGDHIILDGAKLAARDVLIGSHASTMLGRAAKGGGYVSLRGSLLRSSRGTVHVYAHGDGGTIDVSDASLQVGTSADVTLEADVVVR